MGVPSSGGALLAKLDPYLGLRTRAAVHAAGLDEKDLRLTLDEGLQLNAAFKRALMNRIAPYDDRLSDRGTAVLASISHWCVATLILGLKRIIGPQETKKKKSACLQFRRAETRHDFFKNLFSNEKVLQRGGQDP